MKSNEEYHGKQLLDFSFCRQDKHQRHRRRRQETGIK